MNNIQPGNQEAWLLITHAKTANEVINRYMHNRPFIESVILMFDYLARSCMLLWNRKKAVHIFFNYDPKYNEMHYRVIPKDMPTDKSPKERPYNREKIGNAKKLEELITLVRGFQSKKISPKTDIPSVCFIRGEKKQKLSENKHICNMGISKDFMDESDLIVLVMDVEFPEMQSAYCNLGCLVLYGPSQGYEKSSSFKDEPSSKDAVISWSRTFSRFFAENSNTTNKTYIPNHREMHSRKAVILIGDITNFTQLSGLLRIVHTPQKCGEVLGEILREHCKEMSAIVRKYRGRIERFMGDGLMAIFGEHEEDPRIAVGNAVAAAISMVKKFRECRRKIQIRIGGESAENEINEMVELDFSVGINYGTVFFNYLGDERHWEYSCIGDHVAFANRLMSKAARFDLDTGNKWPPILVSQTAEQHLENDFLKGNWKKDRDEARRILHVKGYGYPSYVYGLEIGDFKEDKYKETDVLTTAMPVAAIYFRAG